MYFATNALALATFWISSTHDTLGYVYIWKVIDMHDKFKNK